MTGWSWAKVMWLGMVVVLCGMVPAELFPRPLAVLTVLVVLLLLVVLDPTIKETDHSGQRWPLRDHFEVLLAKRVVEYDILARRGVSERELSTLKCEIETATKYLFKLFPKRYRGWAEVDRDWADKVILSADKDLLRHVDP
ncbi:hypothetical protein DLP3_101 [Stenotrophomonas phage vB_SmaS_DLP_3]|nr:hypothetical protein DLP3_101 [Stenotrophomonas phage vB_SmaS_DLP_3]